MSKLSIGKRRVTKGEKRNDIVSKEAKTFFALGCVLICLMIVPMVGGDDSSKLSDDVMIPAMSGAVETIEKSEESAEDTSTESKEWSVYDYIGQMFADLLFGDR